MAATEQYSIKDVESLTGITAFTLRAWEKRYNGLLPHRTDTNIRYYDGAQVRKLLNIASLVSLGHKASKLIPMDEAQLNKLVVAASEDTAAGSLQPYVNNMVAAMLAFDETAFDKILSAVVIRLGFYEAMLQVIYPFLRKTGVLWSTGNTSPAQEHFASNLLRRKMQASLDGLPCPQHTDKKFLLFLPPDEKHELGLLFCDYLIRSRGHATLYLGQDLPYDSLAFAITTCKPSHLLTFFSTPTDMQEHVTAIEKAAKGNKCTVLICSRSTDLPVNKNRKIHFLASPDELFPYL